VVGWGVVFVQRRAEQKGKVEAGGREVASTGKDSQRRGDGQQPKTRCDESSREGGSGGVSKTQPRVPQTSRLKNKD